MTQSCMDTKEQKIKLFLIGAKEIKEQLILGQWLFKAYDWR